MVATETSILNSFLLPPASLAASLSLQQFTELFPRARQADDVIPALYRELQQQRIQDIQRVKQNIAAEVKRGEAQQRHIRRVRKARSKEELGNNDVDIHMEAQLFPGNGHTTRKTHTVETLMPEMEQATRVIEQEIADMEEEAAQLLDEMKATVGGLSDLRYGYLSKMPGSQGDDLSTEVVQSLERLQQLCSDSGKV